MKVIRPLDHGMGVSKAQHLGTADDGGQALPFPSLRAKAASASFFFAFIAAAVAFLVSFPEVAIQAGAHTDLPTMTLPILRVQMIRVS